MLHQHLKTIRPMSLAAVKGYATALGCNIADISPRWAREVEAVAANLARLPATPPLTPLQRELLAAARDLSERGLHVLIHQARQLATEYPAQTKPGRSSG